MRDRTAEYSTAFLTFVFGLNMLGVGKSFGQQWSMTWMILSFFTYLIIGEIRTLRLSKQRSNK